MATAVVSHALDLSPLLKAVLWTSAGSAHRYQDAYIAKTFGDRLRVGVIDGVTPTLNTPIFSSLDGGEHAALVCQTELTDSHAQLGDIYSLINGRLYNPQIPNSRDNPQAAVCVLEFAPDLSYQALRAADCEAWVMRDKNYEPLFTIDMLTSPSRAEFSQWKKLNPHATHDELYEFESGLLASIDSWNSPPLGKYDYLKLQEAIGDGLWESIILASDGARLNISRVHDLGNWLKSIRSYEKSLNLYQDDVTVIQLTRLNKDT